MSQMSRKEYLAKMRWRYAQRGLEGKSRLLDEVCEVCDYERKYAILSRPLSQTLFRRQFMEASKITRGRFQRPTSAANSSGSVWLMRPFARSRP